MSKKEYDVALSDIKDAQLLTLIQTLKEKDLFAAVKKDARDHSFIIYWRDQKEAIHGEIYWDVVECVGYANDSKKILFSGDFGYDDDDLVQELISCIHREPGFYS